MGYQTERAQFLHQFGRYVSAGTHADALAFLRDASGSQRWNEILSSFDIGERETAKQERREERRDARVKARAERLGLALETNGDPRGNPYALKTADGRTLSVPGRGLPARCFR